MPSIQADAPIPQHRRRQSVLRSVLFATLAMGLILPLARAAPPEFLMLSIPFLACSVIGATRGQRRFWRMLLLGGIGGMFGLWIGGSFTMFYHNQCSFGRLASTVARIDALAFVIVVLNSVVCFVLGAIVAMVVWVIHRIAAKVRAKEITISRLAIYACVCVLGALYCFVVGLWLLSFFPAF